MPKVSEAKRMFGPDAPLKYYQRNETISWALNFHNRTIDITQFLDLGPKLWMCPQFSTLDMIQFQAPQMHIKLRQPCDSLSHKARLAQKLMQNNKQQMYLLEIVRKQAHKAWRCNSFTIE